MNIRHWVASALLAMGTLILWTASATAADNAISTAYVNARSCGSTACGVLYVLPPDTTVEVINVSGSWCQQNRSGYPTAWVSCSYLTALPNGGGGGGNGQAQPNVNFCFTGPGGNQICLGTGGVSANINVPGKQVCFYEEANFTGASMCKTAGYSDNFWNQPWRDNIRSVRVYGGASVLMCTMANYNGYCQTYVSDRALIHNPLRDNTDSVSVN
ncbi:MAG: peptidase inhibitor family I36 protein [Cucumibacter sp.]